MGEYTRNRIEEKVSRRRFLKYVGAASAVAVVGGMPSIGRSQPKRILLGVSHDITGVMAPEGRAEKDGFIMAVEEWNSKGGVNGQKVEYIYRNHGGDPVRASGNAKIFVESGCCAVFGCSNTTAGIAEMKVLAPAQIPMIGGGAGQANFQKGPDGKIYYFAGVGADWAMGKAFIAGLASTGHRNIAILHLNITWGKDLRDIALEWIKREYSPQKGVKCIKAIEADVKATDLSPQIAELKAANIDAVACIVYGGGAAALARAFADLDYHPAWSTYWSAAESSWMKGDPKLLYNNISFSYTSGLRQDTMAKKKEFMDKFGYEPVAHWVTGYDAASLTLRAVKEVGLDPSAIRDWLARKSYGTPVLSGRKGNVCHFRDVEETWLGATGTFYSLYEGTDYAFVRVDKEGKLNYFELQ